LILSELPHSGAKPPPGSRPLEYWKIPFCWYLNYENPKIL